MSYKCYRCHKKLDDKVTKCDKCGAVKIKVPKKEEIKHNTKKRPPYLLLFILFINFIFVYLTYKNITNTDLVSLYGNIAIVDLVFGYILFNKSKLLFILLAAEVVFVYGIFLIPIVIVVALLKVTFFDWYK